MLPTLKCLLILKSSNKAVCSLLFVPPPGKSIRGASGRLPEASDTPAVRTLRPQAGNPGTGRVSTCPEVTQPPTGFLVASGSSGLGQTLQDCPGRDTHAPARPRLAQGWSRRPVADSGCPQPGLHPAFGGVPAGGRAPSGGRRGQKPGACGPRARRGAGATAAGDSRARGPPGLATALPFSTERKRISGKTKLL